MAYDEASPEERATLAHALEPVETAATVRVRKGKLLTTWRTPTTRSR
jgi:hypothetical protein